MRYLVGMMLVLALGALPLRASAQPDWDWCHDPFCPETPKAEAEEAVPDRPVLEVDESRLQVVPSVAPTVEDAENRLGRSRAGVVIGAAFVAGGAGVIAGTMVATRNYDCGTSFFCLNGGRIVGVTAGSVMMLGGLIGAGVAGERLSAAKQELRTLREARHEKRHRVRWDLRTSRFVF